MGARDALSQRGTGRLALSILCVPKRSRRAISIIGVELGLVKHEVGVPSGPPLGPAVHPSALTAPIRTRCVVGPPVAPRAKLAQMPPTPTRVVVTPPASRANALHVDPTCRETSGTRHGVTAGVEAPSIRH